jgi:hypothetical protein
LKKKKKCGATTFRRMTLGRVTRRSLLLHKSEISRMTLGNIFHCLKRKKKFATTLSQTAFGRMTLGRISKCQMKYSSITVVTGAHIVVSYLIF